VFGGKMKTTPDEILSERILSEVETKGLLSKKELEKLRASYFSGKVTPQDWILRVELSAEKEGGNGK
jgi:hypothetical protein